MQTRARRTRHARYSDLLGAHVSTSGGAHRAPARGRAIGATAIQIFTKTPNQWRDPILDDAVADEFRKSMTENGIHCAIAHDSYLINLASPDPVLSRRSVMGFTRELERCEGLGIAWLVSHPGNYIDDRERGLDRNAAAYTACLRAVPGQVTILLELTAGTGTALGATFEELARLRALIASDVRDRVLFCADTCHLYSAGYDLRRDYDAVWHQWDRIVGMERLRCVHLNDSGTPLGSRRDRHALIGEGTLGPEPFRRLMRDPRFREIPKIIETPKGQGDTNDRRMLRRLRGYGRGIDHR